MLPKATNPANRQRSLNQQPQPVACDKQSIPTGNWPLSVRVVQPVADAHNIGPQPNAANDNTVRPRWLTVTRMAAEYNEVITEAALRHLIWNAEAYARFPKSDLPSNGFLPVIVRPPFQRKVLLDRVAFEKWLTANQA